MVDEGRLVGVRRSGRPENEEYRRILYHTFFFDVLSLPGLCSFGNGLAKQGHELAIAETPSSSQRRTI